MSRHASPAAGVAWASRHSTQEGRVDRLLTLATTGLATA